MTQGAGRIRAAGSNHEVSFASADSALNERIDDAYRAKYGTSGHLPQMLTAKVRDVTVEITPPGEN